MIAPIILVVCAGFPKAAPTVKDVSIAVREDNSTPSQLRIRVNIVNNSKRILSRFKFKIKKDNGEYAKKAGDDGTADFVGSVSCGLGPQDNMLVELDGFKDQPVINEKITTLVVESAEFEMTWLEQREIDEAAQKEQFKKDAAERERAILAQPKSVQTDIRAGFIRMGFTEQQVVLSWGQPVKRNKTVTQTSIHTQLVYRSGSYVYLTNGKVTSWQVSD